MGYYKGRPPLNKQNLTNSCWAACIDSFSRATAGVPTYTESALIQSYGVGTNGGLNLSNLNKVQTELAKHRVKHDLISQSNFTPHLIEEKLKMSYLMLMYQTQINSTDWHAILVYGIDNWLIYMDPRKGTYEKTQIYNMISLAGFYAFWKP